MLPSMFSLPLSFVFRKLLSFWWIFLIGDLSLFSSSLWDSVLLLYFWYFHYYVVWIFFSDYGYSGFYILYLSLFICMLNYFSISEKFSAITCANRFCMPIVLFSDFLLIQITAILALFESTRSCWILSLVLLLFLRYLSPIDHQLQPRPPYMTLCLRSLLLPVLSIMYLISWISVWNFLWTPGLFYAGHSCFVSLFFNLLAVY